MTDTPSSSNLPTLGRRGAGWVWIQLLLIGALVATGVRTRGDIEGPALLIAVTLGCILIAIGAILIFASIRQPNKSVSPMPKPVDDGELVMDGPYAYVRHPMYLGLIVTSLGYGVAMDSVWALAMALVFAVFLDLKSRREEVWLRERYPHYATYAAATKRIVPYLYGLRSRAKVG